MTVKLAVSDDGHVEDVRFEGHGCAISQAAASMASDEVKGMPVSELLPGDSTPTPLAPTPKLVIDLERMNELPKEKSGPLARYIATIQSQRGDYNGRVLSVRQEDLRSLAVIYDKSPADLTEELINWGVLDSEARGAIDTL